jgi:hypothetical protein
MDRDQRQGRDPGDSDPAPTTMARIEVHFISGGLGTVMFNGVVRASVIERADVPAAVARLVLERAQACTVTIIEADDTRYDDIVSPADVAGTAAAGDEPAPPMISAPPGLVSATGFGFVPGEDVAIAVVVRSTSAGPDGRARALLQTSELPGNSADILLFGQVSGTVVTGKALQ